MISEAAIRIDGVVFTAPRPKRHHNLLWDASLFGLHPSDLHDQGFMTDDGRYVDRIEGARLALECGQISKLYAPPNLYSEDVW